MEKAERDLETGVSNLLFNCGACRPGDRILIVHETDDGGYYDPGLAPAVARLARLFGLEPQLRPVAFDPDAVAPGAALEADMAAADWTVFFARLGDQLRFQPGEGAGRQIVSYALDRTTLASAFGRTDYAALSALCDLIDNAFAAAAQVQITCPAGTDLSGRMSTPVGTDTTRRRFPRSVFTPVPASGFRGHVAQRGFLTGTGSRYYDPYACEIRDTLFVGMDGTSITGLDGSAADVEAARAHYTFVGDRFGIDPWHVHSWHAGVHPGCRYDRRASAGFERWSGSAFGNPRLLHFHTCGAYPPGEISLNVLDPTVTLDGVALWDSGRLCPERIPGGAALLAAHPSLAALFERPETDVGQGAGGTLSYR